MRLRCCEVKVHRYYISRFDVCFGKNVLARTSLVRRKEIFCSEHILECTLQPVACLASCIRVVCPQHGCLLEVGHRINARIGQHIHKHVFVLKQERIVARFIYIFYALFYGWKKKFLNYAHFVHFKRHLVLFFVEFY